MIEPLIPVNEQERLNELRSYEILDTGPEMNFDQLTELAAAICQTPMAQVNLIDANRQYFKSVLGRSDVSEGPRSTSFCGHAILNDDILEVPDALLDQRFHDNPAVVGDPNIRFYAGAPLINSKGFRLGTLCVFESKSKTLSSDQKKALKALASQVVDQMEIRKINTELSRAKKELELRQQNLIYNAKMQSLGELIAGICHQINNPLAIITGRSMILKSILQDLSTLNSQTQNELNVIDGSVVRIAEILRALKMYIQEPENEQKRVMPIKEAIDDVFMIAKGRLSASDVSFQSEVKSDLMIKVKRSEITQVFLSLVNNSLDAMEGGKDKKIQVKVSQEGKMAVISFIDNGIGVKPSIGDKIFHPFFSTKSVGKSTGLGLSLARDFVVQHGGELNLACLVNPTVFEVKLPLFS